MDKANMRDKIAELVHDDVVRVLGDFDVPNEAILGDVELYATSCTTADTILSALPDMTAEAIKARVKPLVWDVSRTGQPEDCHTVPTNYTIRFLCEDEYRLTFTGGFSVHHSHAAAMVAANARHAAMILASLDLEVSNG